MRQVTLNAIEKTGLSTSGKTVITGNKCYHLCIAANMNIFRNFRTDFYFYISQRTDQVNQLRET